MSQSASSSPLYPSRKKLGVTSTQPAPQTPSRKKPLTAPVFSAPVTPLPGSRKKLNQAADLDHASKSSNSTSDAESARLKSWPSAKRRKLIEVDDVSTHVIVEPKSRRKLPPPDVATTSSEETSDDEGNQQQFSAATQELDLSNFERNGSELHLSVDLEVANAESFSGSESHDSQEMNDSDPEESRSSSDSSSDDGQSTFSTDNTSSMSMTPTTKSSGPYKSLWQRLEEVDHISRSLAPLLADFPSKTTSRSEFEAFLSTPNRTALASHIKIPLKDYQRVGFHWLRILHLKRLNGILADEMGLGKTIQAISLLIWLKRMRNEYILRQTKHVSAPLIKNDDLASTELHPSLDYTSFASATCDLPTLIVTPLSTIDNWRRELNLWAPQLRVVCFAGTPKQRERIKDSIMQHWKTHQSYGFDILLASYQAVLVKKFVPFFQEHSKWHYLILDEAQMMKAKKTNRFAGLSQIQATRRLLLTGTPLQNNLNELANLLAFLMPDVFGSLASVNLSKEIDLAINTCLRDEYLAKFKSLLQPFMLRRLKEHVFYDMLPKKQETLLVKPTKIQRRALTKLFKKYLENRLLPSNPASSDKSSGKKRSNDLLTGKSDADMEEEVLQVALPETLKLGSAIKLFIEMRKVCDHPVLVRSMYTKERVRHLNRMVREHLKDRIGDKTEQETLSMLLDMRDWDLHCLASLEPALKECRMTSKELYKTSGKFKALAKLLPRLKTENHRVVLFSQFAALLDVLEIFLQEKLKLKCLRFDGTVQSQLRQQRIDEFNDPKNHKTYFIFLVTTTAGGVGVNLTSADTVIFFDRGFNPQVERQAEDRCHRIGQTKQVTVYSLITTDTIEEYVYSLARKKNMLSDVILEEGQYAEGTSSADEASSHFSSADFAAALQHMVKLYSPETDSQLIT